MKRLYKSIILCTTLSVLCAFFGCANYDTSLEELKAQYEEAKGSPKEIAIPDFFTEEADPLPPTPVTAKDSTLYNHYIENLDPKALVTIDFNGDKADVSIKKGTVVCKTDGAHVTLTTNRRTLITISGSSDNASLTILPSDPLDKENQYRCGIHLNGVRLHNPHGAVINSQLKKRLMINCLAGTENTLSCDAPATTEGTPGPAIYGKGCIFSEDKIILSAIKLQGKDYGKLVVTSAFRNAIAADDYLIIRPNVRLTVNAKAGNGIKTNDGVMVNGGQTTIFCDAYDSDAIKTDSTVIVSDGLLQALCTGDDSKGIKANYDYIQKGGTVNIVTLGRNIASSPKAIKTNRDIIITNGSIYCFSDHSLAIEADGETIIKPRHTLTTHLLVIDD